MEQQFDKVYMVVEVPEKLKLWWGNFCEEERKTVEGKLGRLVELIDVHPNRDLVQALIAYWRPTRAVFRFKDFELTPILGEIVGLTGLKCLGQEIILPNSQTGKKFQERLGLVRNDSLGCIENKWVHLDYLYTRFGRITGFDDFEQEFNCGEKTWRDRRVRAFVIAFLGTLVFPTKNGHIRTCIGSVVRVMFEGINGNKSTTIVPMILAEMYRALNECRRGSMYFEGCNLLLQVWAIDQMCHRNPMVDICKMLDSRKLVNPIAIQNIRTRWCGKPESFAGWYDFLACLTDKEVMWKLSYVPKDEIALRTSKRYYIELPGLTGLQSYAPLRVLRQFGMEQFIPLCADMSKSETPFNLQNAIPRKREILEDWKGLQPIEVSTKHQSCTLEYLAWVKEERRLGFSPPGRVGYEDTDMTKKMRQARAETSFDETSAPTSKKTKQAGT